MATDKSNASTEDEFYEEAADEFPAKEDFENRLVAVWPTGKTGTRVSEASGKEYPYVETITMALDNGPDGEAGDGMRSDDAPYLVGPAPDHADGFQWSATGVYSRVFPRLSRTMADGSPDYRPVIGRINRRKNAKKGFSDSWSLGKPVETDRDIVKAHEAVIRAMTAKVAKARQAAEDSAAFTE
jgi:hypothetical protein